MKLRKVTLAALLIVMALGVASIVHGTPTLPQNEMLQRSGVWLQNATEGSWFTWNSELYYVYTARNFDGTGLQMKVVRNSDQSVVSTFGTGYGYQDALVDNGTLYVFAASASNTIVKFSTTNLTTWSDPTTIKTLASGTAVYNISAVKAGTDTVVAYEYLPSGGSFTIGFIKSSNYTTWTDTGSAFTGGYLCPELVNVGGTYYMFVGSHVGSQWHTWVAKSANLTTWTWSRLTVLKPTFEFEDVNTTDLDVTEFGGKVYAMYMTGDQSTYMRMTYATFDGTLAQFMEAVQQPN